MILSDGRKKAITIICRILEVIGYVGIVIGIIMILESLSSKASSSFGGGYAQGGQGLGFFLIGLYLLITSLTITALIQIEENTSQTNNNLKINNLIQYVMMKAIASRATNIPDVSLEMLKEIETSIKERHNETPGPKPAANMETVLPDFNFCRKCGEKIKKDDTYCPYCGLKQST